MAKKKIVIVDDDEDLLKLLAAAFGARDFDVQTLSTGKDALKYLGNEKNIQSMHLLILDRMLPDMDGLDILKELEAKFPGKVPVLILSVLSAERDVLAGLKKGAVDYVTKPFSLPILLERAQLLLNR